MGDAHRPDRIDAGRYDLPLRPRGLVDLRGQARGPAVLSYPDGAVVVVSGLPGSGKSTLLRRWSRSATVIDPRTAHVEYQDRMPEWLPYAVYRPWVRLQHLRRLRARVRGGGGPVLVHDCGSRPWLRRWLARTADRQHREVHLILLAVDPVVALEGQDQRGRRVPGKVFDRHRRKLAELLSALSVRGAEVAPEAASIVLLDRTLREHVLALDFGPTHLAEPPAAELPAIELPAPAHPIAERTPAAPEPAP
ncbi:AAA family ATPase [Embleya sp. AB8]|uniref:AAA family ATPase n=1 Tax=Embleya sp. AB8 TaxID=3156304 RepID=UPI003C782303